MSEFAAIFGALLWLGTGGWAFRRLAPGLGGGEPVIFGLLIVSVALGPFCGWCRASGNSDEEEVVRNDNESNNMGRCF